MKIFLALVASLLILAFNGCATFFAGDTAEIELSSEPTQATVKLNGSEVGKTPVKLTLRKGTENIIEFVKEGFEKKTLTMYYSPGTNWLILDFFTGIGILIDAFTSKWNEFDINIYKANLKPVTRPAF